MYVYTYNDIYRCIFHITHQNLGTHSNRVQSVGFDHDCLTVGVFLQVPTTTMVALPWTNRHTLVA